MKYSAFEAAAENRRSSGEVRRNPIYAGTYAWGRSEIVTEFGQDGTRKVRQRSKPVADWEVVLHDHHPGYICREDFDRIQTMMERNRPASRTEASSVLREGAALLQGIVRCGRCGRPMTVRYHRNPNGPTLPTYSCVAAHVQNRGEICQAVGGKRIEAAVSGLLLRVLSEGQLEIELAALRMLNEQHDAVLAQLELQVERARYEAGRLERQYNAVEPENRVVARTLESRWNEALAHVADLEQCVEERRKHAQARLGAQEEREVRELCRALPSLWSHRKVTDKDRKALLRAVVEEVQLHKVQRTVNVRILWKGGEVTDTSVALIQQPTGPKTPVDLVKLVRELATRHTDAEIARVLNRRGCKTVRGRSFNVRHVRDLRARHGIAACGGSDPNPSTYTVEQVAKMLNVSAPTVYSWLKLGVLTGEQIAPGAPWLVALTEADRQRLGGDAPDGWISVDNAATELAVSKQTILNWVKARKIPYAYSSRGRRRGLRVDVNSAPLRRQRRLVD